MIAKYLFETNFVNHKKIQLENNCLNIIFFSIFFNHQKQLVLNHNFYSAIGELWRGKQSIADHTIRSYVEMKIHSSPLAAAFLRSIDTI